MHQVAELRNVPVENVCEGLHVKILTTVRQELCDMFRVILNHHLQIHHGEHRVQEDFCGSGAPVFTWA